MGIMNCRAPFMNIFSAIVEKMFISLTVTVIFGLEFVRHSHDRMVNKKEMINSAATRRSLMGLDRLQV